MKIIQLQRAIEIKHENRIRWFDCRLCLSPWWTKPWAMSERWSTARPATSSWLSTQAPWSFKPAPGGGWGWRSPSAGAPTRLRWAADAEPWAAGALPRGAANTALPHCELPQAADVLWLPCRSPTLPSHLYDIFNVPARLLLPLGKDFFFLI